jgi:hypothetical protein
MGLFSHAWHGPQIVAIYLKSCFHMYVCMDVCMDICMGVCVYFDFVFGWVSTFVGLVPGWNLGI